MQFPAVSDLPTSLPYSLERFKVGRRTSEAKLRGSRTRFVVRAISGRMVISRQRYRGSSIAKESKDAAFGLPGSFRSVDSTLSWFGRPRLLRIAHFAPKFYIFTVLRETRLAGSGLGTGFECTGLLDKFLSFNLVLRAFRRRMETLFANIRFIVLIIIIIIVAARKTLQVVDS